MVTITLGCRIKSITPDPTDVEDQEGMIAWSVNYLIGSGGKKVGFKEF